jgi:AcrR family transcriptional regulator
MGLKERRDREREERKRQILDAARDLLFAEGLQATSVNKIAKNAELGVGTIYSYFKNKEEIFAALQQEGIELLHARAKKAISREKDASDRLRAIAGSYLDFSNENRDYFDIINYFLSSPGTLLGDELKETIDQRGNQIISLIVTTIEEGISAGEFCEVNGRKFAMMFWAAIHGLILFSKLRTTILKGEDYPELVGYSVDYLIDSLIKK